MTATAHHTDPSSPASATQRIISGIDLIDSGAGGLFPNKIYLIKGGLGIGKTIAGLQYLARGLQLDEPGVLITDQNPESVLDQADSIGFHMRDAVKRGQLMILNPSGRYFELVESPADVMAITEELTDYIREVGAKRLVIDPVFSLVSMMYSTHFALSVTQSLINALEELPVTTILIAGDEMNPETKPLIRMIEQNAFGVVTLSADQETGGRIMRLSKMRFASVDHLAAHYRIADGRGLINYRGEGEKVDDVNALWSDRDVNRSVILLGASPDTIGKVREALGETYTVDAETDLEEGIERVRNEKPGLALITPTRATSALQAIAELARTSQSAIAFLSPARNRAVDSILYLRAGADDFITEPFSGPELKARVEALVRRSGRRLLGPADDLVDLDTLHTTAEPSTDAANVFENGNDKLSWSDSFRERLERNVDIVSRFGMSFALYWIRAEEADGALSRSLAELCRQEDILCHNRDGEFVALLTGADREGVHGFETRLDEKLGEELTGADRGFAIYEPGQPAGVFIDRALQDSTGH